MDVALNIALVLVFVLVGGFFAAAEIALVALRPGQVTALVERGGRGRAVAKLRGDSNRFLSAVQIGVTFTGFFASSYGGATIATRLEPVLAGWGLPVALAATGALLVVTALVSYLSLVAGELVPKRLALQRPERVALVAAPLLDRLATLTRPLIWLLSRSTNAVVRVLGVDPKDPATRSARTSCATWCAPQHAHRRRAPPALGRLRGDRPRDQRGHGAAHRGRLPLRRHTAADARDHVSDRPHSRYPVTGEVVDDVIGFVHVRDLLTARPTPGRHASPAARPRPPRDVVPGGKPVLDTLTLLRRGGGHLAVVIDEYGGTDGIVTVEDLVEEIVGEIEDEYDPAVPVRPRHEGTFDVDGLLHRSDVAELTGIELPDGPYDTLGGFVLHRLGRTPEVGDVVEALGHRFEVVTVDGHRVERVRITPLVSDDATADP